MDKHMVEEVSEDEQACHQEVGHHPVNTTFHRDSEKETSLNDFTQPRNAPRNPHSGFDNICIKPSSGEPQALSADLYEPTGKLGVLNDPPRTPRVHATTETDRNLATDSIPKDKKSEEKEKKTISTKTFAHGMMDVSLLTSNATQLRSVFSNPGHEFYQLLIWLILISIVFQVVSGVLLIMSDFYKTQVKEKDQQNQRKRKLLNFIALAMVMVVTAINILISAFFPTTAHETVHVTRAPAGQQDLPSFSSSTYYGASKRTEL